VDELRNADELWITSTTRLINPITQVDDHILTRENFGLIWHRVNDLLQKQLKSITQENLIYD
jgi:branched-subunit amino acid aminotransferase/4-amino-4-deoxychorismate lyase